MKYKFFCLVLGLFLSTIRLAGAENTVAPVAVIELFTSEGCSSCPPADRLLIQLTELTAENPRIFTLGFHVDYWDDLGWTDPFSRPEFSNRQRIYAKTRGTFDVYTPQMIVNGTRVFVGSQEKTALANIEEVLREPAQAQIDLKIEETDAQKFTLSYRIQGAGPKDLLHFAVVENDLSSDVKKGENRGRVLEHANVVRSFQTLPLGTPIGRIEVDLPNGKIENMSVIAYIQNSSNLKISGAAATQLGKKY